MPEAAARAQVQLMLVIAARGLWPTASVTGANLSASRPAAIKGN